MRGQTLILLLTSTSLTDIDLRIYSKFGMCKIDEFSVNETVQPKLMLWRPDA